MSDSNNDVQRKVARLAHELGWLRNRNDVAGGWRVETDDERGWVTVTCRIGIDYTYLMETDIGELLDLIVKAARFEVPND